MKHGLQTLANYAVFTLLFVCSMQLIHLFVKLKSDDGSLNSKSSVVAPGLTRKVCLLFAQQQQCLMKENQV